MITLAGGDIALAYDAYKLASEAGQVLAKLLLNRAEEFARQGGSSVISIQHVRFAIGEVPIEQVSEMLNERTVQAPGKAA